jgi:hypothetical protein
VTDRTANKNWLDGAGLLSDAIRSARRDNKNWLCWQDSDGSTRTAEYSPESIREAEETSWPDRVVIMIRAGDATLFYRSSVERGPAAMVTARCAATTAI